MSCVAAVLQGGQATPRKGSAWAARRLVCIAVECCAAAATGEGVACCQTSRKDCLLQQALPLTGLPAAEAAQ